MSDQFEVRTHEAFGRVKTLFAGTEEDARKFVTDNFPRIHVEPGINQEPTPNVVLISPGGDASSAEHYDGKDWVNPNKSADEPETVDPEAVPESAATVPPIEES